MAADALIERFCSDDQGTFGRLTVPALGFTCFTGELPWRDNRPSMSCIPPGTYSAVWSASPRLRRGTYRLLAVPGRSGVLIHSANLMGDSERGLIAQLQGCIAFGQKLGSMNGQRALLISSPMVRQFETLMARNTFNLEIRNA